jgi:ParB/RepB/Spo0J family partition protein
MGGNQRGKDYSNDDEPTAKDIAVVRKGRGKKNIPDEAITASSMPSHTALSNIVKVGSWEELAQLAEVRVSDPRVQAISPEDPRLVLGKFNVREQHEEYDITETHDSMVDTGQQKPVIVTPRGDNELYIVAGETRTLAAREKEEDEEKAEIEKLYILPVELTDEQAWTLSLYTNLDNSLPVAALSDDEEGKAIEKLVEDYKWTQKQVADFLHRDQSWVSRRLRLLKVDPRIEDMVKRKQLSESHAEVLMTLPKEWQGTVLNHVRYNGYTVKSTQQAVNNVNAVLEEGKDLPKALQTRLINEVDTIDWTPAKVRTVIEATKMAVESGKGLPGYTRDILNEIVIRKAVTAAKAKEIAENMTTVHKEAESLLLSGFPQNLRKEIYTDVANQKISVATAKRRLNAAAAFLGEKPGLRSWELENLLRDVMQRYGEETAREMGKAVKSQLQAGKKSWEMRDFFAKKNWKERLEREAKKTEAEATAESLKEHGVSAEVTAEGNVQIEPSHGEGMEKATAASIEAIAPAAKSEVEGSPALLDESSGPVEAETNIKQDAAAEELGISEQLFGKHISGEVPASLVDVGPQPTDLTTEEELQGAPVEPAGAEVEAKPSTREVHGKWIPGGDEPAVTAEKAMRGGEEYIRFQCPGCLDFLLVDVQRLRVYVEPSEEDSDEEDPAE